MNDSIYMAIAVLFIMFLVFPAIMIVFHRTIDEKIESWECAAKRHSAYAAWYLHKYEKKEKKKYLKKFKKYSKKAGKYFEKLDVFVQFKDKGRE